MHNFLNISGKISTFLKNLFFQKTIPKLLNKILETGFILEKEISSMVYRYLRLGIFNLLPIIYLKIKENPRIIRVLSVSSI